MNAIRSALAPMFALALASLALGGCAVDPASESADGDDEAASTTSQALTVPSKAIDASRIVTPPSLEARLVAPECRAVLVSTETAERPYPNSFACPAADPHTAQQRYAGELEAGLTLLLDEAKPGRLRCATKIPGKLECSFDTDRLIEKTCTEVLTYECPCGVETVDVAGGFRASLCRRVPR